MLLQHASVKLDMLSLHAKHRQAIPVYTAKVIVYKELLETRTVDKLWESEEPDQRISRANTMTLQEARQDIKHEE